MVTAGEYSDYGVVAIYSTKEKAEEFIREFPEEGLGGYNPIEEVAIDVDYAGMKAVGKSIWVVNMDRAGNALKAHNTGSVFGLPMYCMQKPPKQPAFLANWCYAASEEQAIKATNEKRTQLIANGEWD